MGIGKTAVEIAQDLAQNQMILCPVNKKYYLVFMFSTQGASFDRVPRQLMQAFPGFAARVTYGMRCTIPYLPGNLWDILQCPEDDSQRSIEYAEPALFIVEYALAMLFIEFGVKPCSVLGHGVGEYVAACLSGVFSFEDGVALVCQRGLLM